MKKILFLVLSCAYFVSSAQSGIAWTPSISIATSSFHNLHPHIATDANGNPLVIWGRLSDHSVFISRWNGTAFTTPVKINPPTIQVASQSWQGPDIAAKGDTVYVAMKRYPEGTDSAHIYLSASFDGGLTFGAPVQVDNIADSISRFPAVAIDNMGNPVVGFMKFDPVSMGNARWVVTRSNDYGNTFTTDVLASGWSGGTVCDCCPGSIVSNNNQAFMLYRDNDSNIRDIWAGISADGGNSFLQGMAVDQGNWMVMMCPSSGPDGVVIGDTLYSVYMSGATGTYLVYMGKSSVTSLQNSTGVALTGSFAGLSSQNFPRIANAGDAFAVAWKQQVNGMDQLALRFTNDIAAGLPAGFDTIAMGAITNTDVALTNGNIFIVWEDANSGTVKYRKGAFSTTGINLNPQNQNQIYVYPSPASTQLTIQSNIKSTVTLHNTLGEQLFTEQFKEKTTIDIHSLPQGIYFVTLSNDDYRVTKKAVKQ